MDKEQIKKHFDKVVYHYCGPRWSDIGLDYKFKAALINMNINCHTTDKKETSSSAAYRNCSNAVIKSSVYAMVQHENTVKSVVFNLSWNQVGSALITVEDMDDVYVKAEDHQIEISNGFVELINWFFN